MRFHADLHVHSKYSRATSRDLDLEHLAAWAARYVTSCTHCVRPLSPSSDSVTVLPTPVAEPGTTKGT